jgi:23S rRNA (guanosine2251-2'-O)-methyltransferase
LEARRQISVVIYGINPVLEGLRAGRITRVRVSRRADRRIDEVLALAAKQRVSVERVDPSVLDQASKGGVHQGVVADAEDAREYAVHDLVAAPQVPLIIVLDGIEDPHNVGAILRTADAAGVSGVVRQSRHAAALDGIVGKASAGALAHVRIATVVNIARAIEELKEHDVWTIGLSGNATDAYTDVDWTLPSAIVLGAEGAGLRRLVRDRCDRLVRIPMQGAVASLNVSAAAAVVLYEAVRQRGARDIHGKMGRINDLR